MKEFKIVIWDFDGVIKDSVMVKADAFAELFTDENSNLKERIKNHHLKNIGISRFEKIPIYLRWVGKEPSKSNISKYTEKFSELVVDRVVNSKWVPGVEKILRVNPFNQIFILASATPLEELNLILKKLKLQSCFKLIYGSPQDKHFAISETLNKFNIKCSDMLFIGDSITDYNAASKNKIRFLLRTNESNITFSSTYRGAVCKDFLNFV